MSVLKCCQRMSTSITCKNFITNKKFFVRNYTPRRAVLYVPGDSERKLKKTFSVKVDCVIMDCEDGVAINKKQAARETIRNLLNDGKPSSIKSDWAVRINSVESGLCAEDLKVVLSGKNLPDSIVLPKVNTTDHLKWFAEQLKLHVPLEKKLNLIILVESARAMINLVDICKFAVKQPTNFVPTSLIFGSDDFCANIGAVRTDDQMEILYARQKIVLIAKAFDLQAIDMVHINYKDLEGLRKQCEIGMRMGYTGKQVIHPDQVPVTQKAFLPTPKQVEWAKGLLEKFHEHQKSGVGAFNYHGSMIDMPTVKIAENIMELMKIESK